MLVKNVIFALAASSLVSATRTLKYPPPKPTPEPINQCNIKNGAQCCATVEKATDPEAAFLLGLLGVVVEGVDVLVGLTCTGLGVGGCASQAVCCEHTEFNGLINIGCTPISL